MKADRSVRSVLSQLLHRVFNAAGVEVRLVRNLRAAHVRELRDREYESWRVLECHRFACVLDIGANEGQFAAIARRMWPDARVHSFEPLPDVYAALVEQFEGDPRVATHNVGLSEVPGVRRMHRSAFSPSSSLLPMAELHRSEWPQSVEHTEVEVRLERLDDWSRGTKNELASPLLVKIDVQGFELAVINGGAETLRRAAFVVLEVSFHELYQDQPLFAQVHDRLRELGFIYRGNVEQFCSKDRTRVLYADAIFENTSLQESHV